MSLRTRITLVVVSIVAVAVAVGGFTVLYSTSSQLRGQVDSFLVDRTDRFVRGPLPAPGRGAGVPGGGGPAGGGPRGLSDLADPDTVAQVIDRDGSVTSSISGQSALPVSTSDRDLAALGARGGGSHTLRDVTVGGVHYRMVTAALPNGGAVMVARSLAETDKSISVLRARVLFVGFAGTVLAGLVAWVVALRTTRPIRTLTGAAEHVAATQDLSVPIPVTGDDEVGRLAASFNTMLAALERSRDQQRRLVVDASHELRTPLTAVRTNIEFLGRAADLPVAERAQLVAETRLELDELTNLVSELVELATDARADEPVERVDLAELAETVAARYARRSGREVGIATTGAATVDGRPLALDRALSNLVDNALKFSSQPVELVVDGTTLEVRDRGSGVRPEDQALVFERFYRATEARTQPGSGLGLSIVKQIAELHGGTVALVGREGGGTIARLVLTTPPANFATAGRP